jgi:hypothetical protein
MNRRFKRHGFSFCFRVVVDDSRVFSAYLSGFLPEQAR